MEVATKAVEVLRFWFEELKPEQWWGGSSELDAHIAKRFGDVHGQAAAGELSSWRATAAGRLAEILVLDQFSRNIYRNSAGAFACDALALVLSQEAVASGALAALEVTQRTFLLMPFMHSESPAIHQQAVGLFTEHSTSFNLDYELKHKAIVDRFGRYPHRNAVLGRESTDEEREFLLQPGSGF